MRPEGALEHFGERGLARGLFGELVIDPNLGPPPRWGLIADPLEPRWAAVLGYDQAPSPLVSDALSQDNLAGPLSRMGPYAAGHFGDANVRGFAAWRSARGESPVPDVRAYARAHAGALFAQIPPYAPQADIDWPRASAAAQAICDDPVLADHQVFMSAANLQVFTRLYTNLRQVATRAGARLRRAREPGRRNDGHRRLRRRAREAPRHALGRGLEHDQLRPLPARLVERVGLAAPRDGGGARARRAGRAIPRQSRPPPSPRAARTRARGGQRGRRGAALEPRSARARRPRGRSRLRRLSAVPRRAPRAVRAGRSHACGGRRAALLGRDVPLRSVHPRREQHRHPAAERLLRGGARARGAARPLRRRRASPPGARRRTAARARRLALPAAGRTVAREPLRRRPRVAGALAARRRHARRARQAGRTRRAQPAARPRRAGRAARRGQGARTRRRRLASPAPGAPRPRRARARGEAPRRAARARGRPDRRRRAPGDDLGEDLAARGRHRLGALRELRLRRRNRKRSPDRAARVRLRLPAEIQATSARWLVPGEPERELELRARGGTVELTIPALRIYGVLVARPEGRRGARERAPARRPPARPREDGWSRRTRSRDPPRRRPVTPRESPGTLRRVGG